MFHVAAARTWNSLPPDVTSSPSLPTFKRHLKTVLFARSYSAIFACASSFYLAVTRVFFVFLCGVLPSFDLRHHNQFVHDDGDDDDDDDDV